MQAINVDGRLPAPPVRQTIRTRALRIVAISTQYCLRLDTPLCHRPRTAPRVAIRTPELCANSDQGLVLRFVEVLPDEHFNIGRTIDAGQVAREDHFCDALGGV